MGTTARFKVLVDDFSMNLRIDRALDFAHTGNTIRALSVLMPKNRFPDNHQELDIIARLYVRSKEYKFARKCWDQAIINTPDNKMYHDARNALDQYLIKREQKIRQIVKIISFSIGLLLLMATLALAACWLTKKRKDIVVPDSKTKVIPEIKIAPKSDRSIDHK
jgi:hypothetical protein